MDRYSMVVSRGYVRLVREAGPGTRPKWPHRLADLVHWEDLADQDDNNDDWQGEALDGEFDDFYLSRYGNPSKWGGDLEDDDYPVPDDDDEYLIPDEELEDRTVEMAIAAAKGGRGDSGLSNRSRMNMRRLFLSLPWELCGPRPALISLTYPADWVRWVPDGRTWERHRKSFERRWVRRWGEPLVGVWVKEFQGTGRPHLHLYVGLPTAMSAEDFAGLRERTLLRHRLERIHGTYEGRKRVPPIGGDHGGEFGLWLRQAWSEVVGTKPYEPGSTLSRFERGGAHHARGADVAVMFWSDEAEQAADRTKVADYLAREAGKWRQKMPPAGFVGVGRFYGSWGRSVGFEPESTTTWLDPLVAAEVERRLVRWVGWKLAIIRHGAPRAGTFAARRRGNEVAAFGLGPDQAARLLRWSEAAASPQAPDGMPGRPESHRGTSTQGELVSVLDRGTGCPGRRS